MRHISMAINKTASRNILRKITKMVNNSNDPHRDIRQCHFPGDQNRAEDRYKL